MQALQLKPTVGALSSTKSSFRGFTAAFQRLSIAQQPAARQQLVVEGEQRAAVFSWRPSSCICLLKASEPACVGMRGPVGGALAAGRERHAPHSLCCGLRAVQQATSLCCVVNSTSV
jgi:hypothetical protein